jgi:putative transposase
MAAVDHDGGGVLRRGAGGSSVALRHTGDLQHTGALLAKGIAISMDGKGAWRDDVFVERLWRTIKYEEVYLRAYDTVSDARGSLGRYIAFYNSRRPHSSLDRQPPDLAYFNRLPLLAAA